MCATRFPGAVFLLGSALVLAGCGGSSTTGETAPASPAVTEESTPQVSTGSADTSVAPGLPIDSGTVTIERVEAPGTEAVRRYVGLFYGGELDELYSYFSDEMKNEILPRAALQELYDGVTRELGEEVEILGEDSQTRGEYRGFVRWARFAKFADPVEMQWILREDDSIAGFFIRPAPSKQPPAE